jgi:chromosomal replication initiation ATPase DnaA
MWAEIEPADDGLLSAMMRKVFSDEQVRVPYQVVEQLLNHNERSFETLLRAAQRINTYALATKRKITLPLVKEALMVAP